MSNNDTTLSLKNVLDRCAGHTNEQKKAVAEASGMSIAHIHRLYNQSSMDSVKLGSVLKIISWANENLAPGVSAITLNDIYAN